MNENLNTQKNCYRDICRDILIHTFVCVTHINFTTIVVVSLQIKCNTSNLCAFTRSCAGRLAHRTNCVRLPVCNVAAALPPTIYVLKIYIFSFKEPKMSSPIAQHAQEPWTIYLKKWGFSLDQQQKCQYRKIMYYVWIGFW